MEALLVSFVLFFIAAVASTLLYDKIKVYIFSRAETKRNKQASLLAEREKERLEIEEFHRRAAQYRQAQIKKPVTNKRRKSDSLTIEDLMEELNASLPPRNK